MKRIVRVVLILVIGLIAVVLCLPLFIHANDFRPTIQAKLSQALGRDVKVGDLKLAIFSGGVTADDLAIADDPAFSRTPFIHAKSLKVSVEMIPLILSRKLYVKGLSINQPEIALLQSTTGKWNYSSLGAKHVEQPGATPTQAETEKAPLDLTVKLIDISNGRASLQRLTRGSQPIVLENVNAEVHDFSAASAFPFSLTAKVAGGGDLDLRGNLGPINESDTAKTPAELSVKVKGLDLAHSGIADASTAIAGIASIDGNAKSDGHSVHAEGKLRAERLKLVKGGSPASRPVELDFAVDHDTGKLSGVLSRGDIHIGSASAKLTGTYQIAHEPAVLHLKLSGPGMPLPELLAVLPALDIVLPGGSSIQGGVVHAHIATDGPVGALVSGGSLAIENMRLAGFDLGSKLATVERLAGIESGPNTEIQTLSANVKVAPDGTTANDIHVVAKGIGEMTGAGTISPAHALDFKMRANVHTSGALLTALGQHGDLGVPFVIQGTSSNPVFRPDVRAIAIEQLKSFTGPDAGQAVTGLLRGLLGGKKQK